MNTTTQFIAGAASALLALFLTLPQSAHAALTVNPDSTVTDSVTGLMWDQCSQGQSGADCVTGTANTMNWSAALGAAATANTVSYKGYNDWRLPNKNELESLVNFTASNPAIDTAAFPATPSNSFYWSSTTSSAQYTGPSAAWFVYFFGGITDVGGKTLSYAVRLVRSGQLLDSFDVFAVVPSAPTIGIATAGNAQASITFTAPANGGSMITGYTATCGANSTNGTASPIAVTGLTNGIPVTCTVRATNATGNGTASATSNSVIPAAVPGAPVIGAATAGNAQATVSFTAPASNGGATISGYTVTCGNMTATGTALSLTVTGLNNGSTYTCSVTAANAMGSGLASSTLSVTPVAPTTGAVAGGSGTTTTSATPIAVTIGEISVTFTAGITGAGTITVTPITASSAGALPAGFTAILAANITSTATTLIGGNIVTCFVVGAVSDATTFASLRVYHLESGAWADRTLIGSHDFANRRVCASTYSLSPFAVMQPVAASAASAAPAAGNGGGCATSTNSTAPDPTLPLLLVLAGVYALRRRVG